MTVAEIRQEVTENMKLAGQDVPGVARLQRLVNRAKDSLVWEMERLNENIFTTRKTYDEIETGDAGIDLPADFRRLIGLTRTDGSYDTEIVIVPYQERRSFSAATDRPIPGFTSDSAGNSAIMYREGNTLQFVGRDGAPASIELTMRYRRRVADIAEGERQAGYDDIPPEWHALISDRATTEALLLANPEHGKYARQYATGVLEMRASMNRQIADTLPGVRYVDGY